MPKIVLDRSGNLHKSAFYRFNVPFEDKPAVEVPTPDWIIVPRTPTKDELRAQGAGSWMWVNDSPDFGSCAENKDCPADRSHVTFSYYTKIAGECFRGKVSPIIAAANSLVVVLSDELKQRVELLTLSGARIDAMKVTDHQTNELVQGFGALQFVGKARRRLPKFLDVPNRCPHCGEGKIMCEGCGYWTAYCSACNKPMVIIEDRHQGKTDKQLPFEDGCGWRILEGKTWDGSDLIGGTGFNYASKRFIDWLLRIHAAPFYAEPVYFCVDGMSDQQKKWLDDLQKPFEV